jgi:hypothetical protein
MKTKLDICGNIPVYGDFAAFNPPYFKGLRYGEIIGFVETTGNPIIRYKIGKNRETGEPVYRDYSPRTGYVIVKPPII